MIGTTDRRSQDRERKISNASTTAIEPTVPIRSSLADARGSIQLGYDSDVEKEDKETEKPQLKRQNSNTSSASSGVLIEEKRKMSSFASLAPSTTTWQQQSLNSNQVNEIRKNILVASGHADWNISVFRWFESAFGRRYEVKFGSYEAWREKTPHREGEAENRSSNVKATAKGWKSCLFTGH